MAEAIHHTPKKTKKNRIKRSAVIATIGVALLAGLVVTYLFFIKTDQEPMKTNQDVIINQNLPSEPAKKGVLKNLSGEEFRNLYNTFAYPNTEYISEDTVITGDGDTDAHIQNLAEKRGYVRRSAPVSNVFKTVQKDMQLQERAATPWQEMQEAAKKDRIYLNLTAAYRSANEQRQIFLERLGISAPNYKTIANGSYDGQINQVLSMTAIPGYSRHHTGYTIDIGCENQPNVAFENTVCFDWLSADNYKNAKTYGFIPSYPEGAGKQGPEPESWEYVWVGKETLTE